MCQKDSKMHRITINPNLTLVPDPMFPADPKASPLLKDFDEVFLTDMNSLKELEATPIFQWSRRVIDTYGGCNRCPVEVWIEQERIGTTH
jgi:hypothetical protein